MSGNPFGRYGRPRGFLRGLPWRGRSPGSQRKLADRSRYDGRGRPRRSQAEE